MANLYLTHKCNRGCSFCFARKVLKESGENVDELLTIEEIKTLLSHFSGEFNQIGLLGGEPFLYPYLGEVLELLWQQNIIPKIFTSATDTMPKSIRYLNIRKHLLKFIVNVGTRDSYTDEKYKNLNNFFAKFHAVSSLSYTILALDANPEFLFDIIDHFKLLTRSIRIGVALPIYKGGNQYVDKKDYKDLGKFIIKFAQMAYKRNVMLEMDCGFTACMFTQIEFGILKRLGVRSSFVCDVAIDIGPGLKAWNCFPLFQLHKENVLESKSINELIRKFNTKMNNYFNHQVGIYEECVDCKYYKWYVCQGGCKSFKSFNN
ncbi:MAG: radical SAM protein [Bacteroidales bacterium]|jgi:radical SAM protein with 4Fe4S-binding SPASM domain|nr:radical SAM protein [Bacteroidales bacterium]